MTDEENTESRPGYLDRDFGDPDDVHAYCSDCGKQLSDEWYIKQGIDNPACNSCGGVVIVANAAVAARQIAAAKAARGIPGQNG